MLFPVFLFVMERYDNDLERMTAYDLSLDLEILSNLEVVENGPLGQGQTSSTKVPNWKCYKILQKILIS